MGNEVVYRGYVLRDGKLLNRNHRRLFPIIPRWFPLDLVPGFEWGVDCPATQLLAYRMLLELSGDADAARQFCLELAQSWLVILDPRAGFTIDERSLGQWLSRRRNGPGPGGLTPGTYVAPETDPA